MLQFIKNVINIIEVSEYKPIPNTDYMVINGRWHLNNRNFNELSVNERSALAERIKTN